MRFISLSIFMTVVLVLPGCTTAETVSGMLGEINHPKEEFRGAWLTSVSNLDWPVSNTQSVEEQKADAIAILDSLKAIGINAVLFQVRAESDALFASSYDPWSYWLTGEQGRAPDPFYDPLSFMVREAHRRGMELHAWLNPYRLERQKGRYEPAGSSIGRREPDWVLEFQIRSNTNYTMLDPGLPEVRDYVTNVVVDIIRRYNVDGIHFDDYFYPYTPVTNEDSLTFRNHHNGFENIEDWRRDNVNRLVAQVHDSIHANAPHVKFGISPVAIRKNENAGTRGFEGYYQLYADGLAWLEQRTIDYISPQLYFEIGYRYADYAPLLLYWANAAYDNQRHLYAGLSPYKLMEPTGWTLQQAVDQLAFNIDNGMVHGQIFFRTEHILSNIKGYTDVVSRELYRYPALTPVMPWKSMLPPAEISQIAASRSGDGRVILTWADNAPGASEEKAARFVVYRIDPSSDIFDLLTGAFASDSGTPDTYSVTGASSQMEIHTVTEGSSQIETHTVTKSSSGDYSGSLNELLYDEILQARFRIDITGQQQFVDHWPEHRSEAIYLVTSVSHNSIESEPVIIRTRFDGQTFTYTKL